MNQNSHKNSVLANEINDCSSRQCSQPETITFLIIFCPQNVS